MTQHTPVPWIASYDNRGLPFVATDKGSHKPHSLIAEVFTPSAVYSENQSDLDAEAAANADFIVAACNQYDDLLEALELLTEMTDDPISRYMGCRSARLDIARAALAKAKDGVA